MATGLSSCPTARSVKCFLVSDRDVWKPELNKGKHYNRQQLNMANYLHQEPVTSGAVIADSSGMLVHGSLEKPCHKGFLDLAGLEAC